MDGNDGTLYLYVLNLQGDVIRVITETGATAATYVYDAWGKVISSSGSMAEINPIRYRGYYYDTETGLYYLGSRYYDPQVKRFVNADNSKLIPSTAGSLSDKNLFAYCDNNPVTRVDDGGEFWNIVIGAVVGGLASAAVTAYTSYRENGKIDWLSTGISASVGAINGGIAATGMGAVAQAVLSGVVSAAGSIASSMVSRESAGKTIAKAAISGSVGAVSSLVGTAVGKIFTDKMQSAGKLLIKKGALGRSTFTRAASRQMIAQGKRLVNLVYCIIDI